MVSWLDSLTSFEEPVDIVLASYSIHHTFSRSLVARALEDGTFGRVFKLVPSDTPPRYHKWFFDAVRQGKLFGDVPVDLRESAASQLRDLAVLRETLPLDEGRRVKRGEPDGKAFLDRVDSALGQYLPDLQSSIYEKVATRLRPGGIIAVADPNGYSSTFNRQQVVHDWPIVMSHFSDWTRVVGRLARLEMEGISVWRQVRRLDNSVQSLSVPSGYVDLAACDEEDVGELKPVFHLCSAEGVHPLEIEDQHLGYIVVAQKK